jgi:hypothetical protein
MNKSKLLLFSVSPLLIGYLINGLMMEFGWYGMSMSALAVLFAAFWFYGGYRACECADTRHEANLFANGFITLDLFFIALQLVLLGHFLTNQLGFVSQMVFLPILRISAIVRSLLFFLPMSDMLGIFILSWLVMILLFNLGFSLRKRRG